MKRELRVLLSALAVIAMTIALGLGTTASAKDDHGRVKVTPTDLHGWSCVPPTADTRAGGQAAFVVDPSAPAGRGALELTTDLTTTAKVQCLHSTATSLADITQLSYWTKQNFPPGPIADPAYQLAMCLNASTTTCGFSTLVFEPYQGGEGLVLPGVWQKWDVAAGLFWSTRTVACSNGTIVGTPGGPATYTLDAVKTACPDAFIFQFLVNVGTNNPGYNVETDLFNFNGTTYDFEPAKDCKKDDDKNEHDDNDSSKSHCDDGDDQDD